MHIKHTHICYICIFTYAFPSTYTCSATAFTQLVLPGAACCTCLMTLVII